MILSSSHLHSNVITFQQSNRC